jgi:hypothetical protein
MAVFAIDNQALDFTSEEAIYCRTTGKNYYQIFPNSECSEVEFNLTAETDIELFSNPNFTDLTTDPSGWSWNLANVNNNQVILPPTGYIEQTVTGLTIGAYYRVCIQIKDITPPQALAIVLSGSAGFNNANTFNEEGIWCSYFVATDVNTTITFASTASVRNITIDSASIKEISVPVVEIQTCDGDVVSGTSETIDLYENTAKVTFCWSQLDNGCYKMCISPAPETALNLLDGVNLITAEGGRGIILTVNTASFNQTGRLTRQP